MKGGHYKGCYDSTPADPVNPAHQRKHEQAGRVKTEAFTEEFIFGTLKGPTYCANDRLTRIKSSFTFFRTTLSHFGLRSHLGGL